MTIEFKDKEIKEREQLLRGPFVGYFSPDGKLIDYSVAMGENHHDDWRNPVSQTFITFISFIIKGISIQTLQKEMEYSFPDNQYPGIDEFVKLGCDHLNQYYIGDHMQEHLKVLHKAIKQFEEQYHSYGQLSDYGEFQYRLLLFFRNAYRDQRFFDAIGRKITVENPDIVKENINREFKGCELSDRELNQLYYLETVETLLSYLKDICVQYLGYDSLEMVQPNSTRIVLPKKYDDFDFLGTPRIITSTYPNINERYFNYFLMDWEIYRVPRYLYDSETGLYTKRVLSMFYQSTKEEELAQEIQSIKKLVPLQERPKYFR